MQFVVNGLVAGSGYAIVAISFAIIYLPAKFFNFTHGAIYTVGDYLAFVGVSHLGLPLPLAAMAAILGTALLGAVVELLIYRPLRRRNATAVILLLASLGLYVMFQNTISLVFGDNVRSLGTGRVLEGLNFLTARVTPVQLLTIAVSLACFVLVSGIMRWTKWGIELRAVAEYPELAQVCGIRTDRMIVGATALGSGLAAIASVLAAIDVDMTPTMGLGALMMGVVASILGGVDRILGALVGGLLLGLAQHLSIIFVGSEWQDSIAFVVLLFVLAVRPFGIFGHRTGKAMT